MEKIVVRGGRPIRGSVRVGGAKNAVLPIIAATLLTEDSCLLHDVPALSDVQTACDLVRGLGVRVERGLGHTLRIDAGTLASDEAPCEEVRRMRASFLVMGPLLARRGRGRMCLPGGCAIGTRPIDLHLKGLAALGASIEIGHGMIQATAGKLTGARVYLDFPSVGATENIMMAATLAAGTTVIENAAEEPEIVDLATFLNALGARVSGAGTNIIRVEGVSRLHGASHTVIPDRIEAGTFMVMAAATGGDLFLENVIPDHLKPVVAKLGEAGAEVAEEGEGLRVRASGRPEAVDVKTMPYPGFPTDMQAQLMAYLSVASGTSVITETVFENRFMHVGELKRMGARIQIEGHSAVVQGVPALTGARVQAPDLRAGAALITAGLLADGITEITGVQHIDRGYEDIVRKLQGLGADIHREEDREGDRRPRPADLPRRASASR